jgi:hypothetical protein
VHRRLDWVVVSLGIPLGAAVLAYVWYVRPLDVGAVVAAGLRVGWLVLAPAWAAAYAVARGGSALRTVAAGAIAGLAAPALLFVAFLILFAIAAADCPPDAYECPFG